VRSRHKLLATHCEIRLGYAHSQAGFLNVSLAVQQSHRSINIPVLATTSPWHANGEPTVSQKCCKVISVRPFTLHPSIRRIQRTSLRAQHDLPEWAKDQNRAGCRARWFPKIHQFWPRGLMLSPPIDALLANPHTETQHGAATGSTSRQHPLSFASSQVMRVRCQTERPTIPYYFCFERD